MSAGWVYRATVRHVRRERTVHAFTASAVYVQVDIDSALSNSVFALDRSRPASISSRDYVGGGSEPIRARLARFLPGVDDPARGERIYLTTMPRLFGYAFNPISVFLCVDADNRPTRALVEVHNTYGEVHVYPLPAIDAEGCARVSKELFVSPFFGVDGEYEFRFTPPGPRLGLSVRLVRAGETALEAGVYGEGAELTGAAMLRALSLAPWSALATYPRIAWEALVLQYLKGLSPRMRPRARTERTLVSAARRRA